MSVTQNFHLRGACSTEESHRPVSYTHLDVYKRQIEDKDFAVVYNGSVGGTYEVFLKHTEQEIRDHITRYGIGRALSLIHI